MSSSSINNDSALTFGALGVTLATGSILGVSCFLVFGVAMFFQCPLIAPRCTARPKETIYHPNLPSTSTKYKVQDRGNPFFGWISWVMKLPYDTLLTGIPGTGTRKQGLAGKMLQVNLDGVVLLKYHLIGFKITLLTTLLALCVILPLNITYQCHTSSTYSSQCVDPKTNQTYDLTNFTNFERTTIANIPALSNITFFGTAAKDIIMTPWWWQGGKSGIMVRLYIIAFCTWILYLYSWYLLDREWKEILVLRRVYYLEDDIWGRRRDELEALETIRQEHLNESSSRCDNSDDEEDGDDDEARHGDGNPSEVRPTPALPPPERKLFYEFSFSLLPKVPGAKMVEEGISNFQEYRKRISALGAHKESRLKDVWIFDPEERDTIPNIELYSVLVGHVPTSVSSSVLPFS